MRASIRERYRFDLALVLRGRKQEYVARGWTIEQPSVDATEITLRDVTFSGDNLPEDPWGLARDREILTWSFPMSSILFWVAYKKEEAK